MENQTQPEQQLSQKIDDPQMIGIRKYEFLKSLKAEDLSEKQKMQIEAFEKKQRSATPAQIEKQINYLQGLLDVKAERQITITAKKLWELFKENFQTVNNKVFVKTEGVTIKNLEPLIYYFSRDERFFNCENLSQLSEPSFDKGLLIVGTFGNGKTATMKVFEHIFKGVPGITFKGYSTNEAVLMFEKCTGENAETYRREFEQTMYRGTRYFDDMKTERIASNYGKVNIFKEIMEERYNRKSKTFVTCNYKEGFEGDLEVAIDEFGEKYGARVYDRIFEMFNIIEFKGKSFRK